MIIVSTDWSVGKWRQRLVKERLVELADAARVGAPRKLTDELVERVVTRTLERRLVPATHWSTRQMARASGLTQNPADGARSCC